MRQGLKPLKPRDATGPFFVIALALGVYGLQEHALIAHLGPLFVCVIAYAAAMGGTRPGLVTAACAIVCSCVFQFSTTSPADISMSDMIGLVTISVASIATALMTGMLRSKVEEASRYENERHAPAERLASALDQINIGVVLLDRDTRAEFINRAFRNLFQLPDDKADSKPPLIALMYHSRDSRTLKLPEDELDSFIAKRTEMIRAGDSVSDLHLANGTVLRLSCTALPNGGRMLSYTPVTDLIRWDDPPAMRDELIAMRVNNVPAITEAEPEKLASRFSDRRKAS